MVNETKKKIKVNYAGFWNDFDPYNNLFYLILSQRYTVEISENPDYVFCSPLGAPFEYMKYDCVRIFYTGEPVSPDFTLFDYAIAHDYIEFGDRYMRYPFCLWRNLGEASFPPPMTEEEATQLLNAKTVFCNFIYGHLSLNGKREALMKEISKYKAVDSAGTFMNNRPDGSSVRGVDKFNLLKISKFTIAAESMDYPGFTTEKLVHPFVHRSIPVYSGNPLVTKMFNPKAFINCNDYSSLSDIVERIREIDSNDNLFIEMMMQPIEVEPDYTHNEFEKLKAFLYNIFDQNPQSAFRRERFFTAARHEEYCHEYMKLTQSKTYKLLKKLHCL